MKYCSGRVPRVATVLNFPLHRASADMAVDVMRTGGGTRQQPPDPTLCCWRLPVERIRTLWFRPGCKKWKTVGRVCWPPMLWAWEFCRWVVWLDMACVIQLHRKYVMRLTNGTHSWRMLQNTDMGWQELMNILYNTTHLWSYHVKSEVKIEWLLDMTYCNRKMFAKKIKNTHNVALPTYFYPVDGFVRVQWLTLGQFIIQYIISMHRFTHNSIQHQDAQI